MKSRLMLRSVCAAAVLGVPVSAVAQNAAPAPAQAEAESRSEQDIVVTALKRSENLQDTRSLSRAADGVARDGSRVLGGAR